MRPHVFLAASLIFTSPLRAADLRLGIIGCDTSHVTAFTETINNPGAKGHVPGAKVVAAYKGGSRDIPESWDRVEQYSKTLQEKYGVRFYESIEELCHNVDAVLLESVDGRPHLEQMRRLLAAQRPVAVEKGATLLLSQSGTAHARLPVFVDKPMAGSLADVRELFRLAKAAGVPIFSASALRYGRDTQAVRNGSIGKVRYAETSSPCKLEPHHPDLFWYGVHGVESLFTVMGTGCETVRRRTTPDGRIEVIGNWRNGRQGIYREDHAYGGLAKGENGEAKAGSFDGYEPLIAETIRFFQTGVAPVRPEETIEIFAFMAAADESKRRDGALVALKDMLQARSR